MEIDKFDLVPGIVIDVDDPEKLGRIKCSAVGLFDPSTMDNDILPWVMPIKMNKYQMFSKQEVGRKVWILDNTENENEFWYFTMFDYIDVTERLVKERYDNELDLIISRKTPTDSAQLHYNNQDGFVIHYDEWKWNMRPNGDILCHGKEGDVDIRSGHVYAGRNAEEGDYEPSVKCEQLRRIFRKLSADFQHLADLASKGYDNPMLVEGFLRASDTCNKAGTVDHGICAKNVSIN